MPDGGATPAAVATRLTRACEQDTDRQLQAQTIKISS
jgi:hypothetical protein